MLSDSAAKQPAEISFEVVETQHISVLCILQYYWCNTGILLGVFLTASTSVHLQLGPYEARSYSKVGEIHYSCVFGRTALKRWRNIINLIHHSLTVSCIILFALCLFVVIYSFYSVNGIK